MNSRAVIPLTVVNGEQERPGGKGRALIWNRTKGGDSVIFGLPSLARSPVSLAAIVLLL